MATAFFSLGQRVQSLDEGRHRGTVKFIGPVVGQKGEWIGVEWDDHSRGRHDGETGGVKYFQCTVAGAGSFVRPPKIAGGITVLEALKKKFLASESGQEEGLYILSVKHRRLPVELVGRDSVLARQGHLDHLKGAYLHAAGVSSVGPPGELQSTAGNIQEMDLSCNLLPDWQAVGELYVELPKLELLDLSGNMMKWPEPGAAPPSLPSFDHLKILILHGCRLHWGQMEVLKGFLWSLEELHLPDNEISDFEGAGGKKVQVSGFALLRVLNLERNKLCDWSEVLRLSSLPCLEELVLSGNCIGAIWYPPVTMDSGASPTQTLESTTEAHPPFAKLRTLLLRRNKLRDWPSLDALNSFPGLQDVRLTENPITDSAGGGAVRYMIVARVRNLTTLNGSEVKARERKEAEIRYVRHVMSEMPSASDMDVTALHPRFVELRTLHDISPETVQIGTTVGRKLAEGLLQIALQCVVAEAGERAPVMKKLPGSTTVGKLKMLCGRLFKLPPSRLRLFFSDVDGRMPVALDNDGEALQELGFGRAATVLVGELDPTSVEKDLANIALEQEKRLQHQLRQGLSILWGAVNDKLVLCTL